MIVLMTQSPPLSFTLCYITLKSVPLEKVLVDKVIIFDWPTLLMILSLNEKSVYSLRIVIWHLRDLN